MSSNYLDFFIPSIPTGILSVYTDNILFLSTKLAMKKIWSVKITIKYRWKKFIGVSVCIHRFSSSVWGVGCVRKKYHSFETRPGPIDRPGAGTGSGWWKNRKSHDPTDLAGWPGDPEKHDCNPLTFFNILKRRHFDFFKNKDWPGRPGDPVKTRNPGLGPGQV